MIETITNYKIFTDEQKIITEETKTEMVDIFRFLLIFSEGFCLNLKSSNSIFPKLLIIWQGKMGEAGFIKKKINSLVMQFMHGKERYLIFPEKDFQGSSTKSLQTLKDWGDEAITGGDLKQETINEEENIILAKLTDTQNRYLEAFNSGFDVERIAIVFNTSEDTVRAMRRKLQHLLKDLEEGGESK